MGVSKVEIMENGKARTIMDLTGDTVEPEALAEGYTAHNATGEPITGKMKTTTVLYTEQNLTTEQKAQARDNIDATGVYIGSGDMPDGYNIQIDPNGDVDVDDTVTREEFNQLQEEIDDQNGRIAEAVNTEFENEKGNIVQLLIEALHGMPVFGVVDENNTVTLTTLLPKGTYNMQFEYADGTKEKVSEFVIGSAVVEIVNLLESAVGAQGIVLDGVGYVNGYYLSGNASVNGNNSFMAVDSVFFTTGFIPYTNEQISNGVPIYIKGVDIDTTAGHTRMAAFPSYDHAAYVEPIKGGSNLTPYVEITKLGEKYYRLIPKSDVIDFYMNDNSHKFTAINYVRFSLSGSGEGVIITVDQPIP